MSRDDGFSIGDRSTRTLYDVRLVRATRKVGLAAVVAWDAVLDASWEAGSRVCFDDAVDPLPYDLGDTTPIRAALTEAGLLEDGGLIREMSWSHWFDVASERREAKRERDRAYQASRRSRVAAESHPVASESQAVVPSYRPTGPTDRPTGPSSARTRANGGVKDPGPERITEILGPAMAAIGFHPAPKPGAKR